VNASGAGSSRLTWLRHAAARSALFVLSAAVGSVITLVVAAAAGYLGGTTPALPEQLNAILADASKQGLEPTYIRDVDLRGTGESERLLILRSPFTPQHLTRGSRKSDELRLYRLTAGHWHLAYRARPQPFRGAVPYHIRIIGIGSFDSTDRHEAILRLDPEYADTELPRPVALLWSQSKQGYELWPLLRETPRFPRLHGAWAEATPKLVKPMDIDLVSGLNISKAGSAPWLAVARSHLVAAYPVDKTCNGCAGIWEIKTFCINFQEPTFGFREQPAFSPTGREEHDLVHLPGHGEGVHPALEAALRRTAYCE
jgi:hypothetical protein